MTENLGGTRSYTAREVARERAAETQQRQYSLTPVQKEFLALAAKGLSNDVISQMRSVSKSTVKNQFGAINRRFKVHDRTLAVLKGLGLGQISLQQVVDSENDFGFEKFDNLTHDERAVLDSLLDSIAEGVPRETRDAVLKKTKKLCEEKKLGNITLTAVSYFAYKKKQEQKPI